MQLHSFQAFFMYRDASPAVFPFCLHRQTDRPKPPVGPAFIRPSAPISAARLPARIGCTSPNGTASASRSSRSGASFGSIRATAPTTQNGSPACARPSPLHYPWSPQSSTASCTWSICRRGTVLAPMLSAPQSPRCLTRDLVTMRLGLHNECLELVATAQLLLWFRSTVQ